MDVTICQSGADANCIAKYGTVYKSMMMINDAKAIAKLSKSVVSGTFEEALKTA